MEQRKMNAKEFAAAKQDYHIRAGVYQTNSNAVLVPLEQARFGMAVHTECLCSYSLCQTGMFLCAEVNNGRTYLDNSW